MRHTERCRNFEITIDLKRDIDMLAINNGEPICTEICLRNISTRACNSVKLAVCGEYVDSAEFEIGALPPSSYSGVTNPDSVKLKEELVKELKYSVSSEITLIVTNCGRQNAIFRLPITICSANREVESKDKSDCGAHTSADSTYEPKMKIEVSTRIIPTRIEGWERKLLDLSMRNPMLNLRPGRNIIPLKAADIGKITECLSTNKIADLADTPDEERYDRMRQLYRSNRINLEETGANTLFLVIGQMRWFETDDTTPRLAPLLFIPVVAVRAKSMTYEIRLRDDEPVLNFTLLEMLRQMFGISFPDLQNFISPWSDLPDTEEIIKEFKSHVSEINKNQPEHKKWRVELKSYIGIFSFTKYLMWNDVHSNLDIIEQHPLLQGFVRGHYPNRAHKIEAAEIEGRSHTDYMLPIDYDSSQLEAVAECHSGNSFVLHGPPGTGKSQTITNMIADAIYSGKRVLFVAEKKAALEVVRQRLGQIGLEPFCLELHSNKADKKSFFSQLTESKIRQLGAGKPAETTVMTGESAEATQRLRDNIDGATQAVHAASEHGLSLYECACRFLEKRYEELPFKFDDIARLDPDEIKTLCSELASLDLVAEIMGFHPTDSGLLGLYPRENTSDNQNQLAETLQQLPESVVRARRKASGWFNRLISRKTAKEILCSYPEWHRLESLASIPEQFIGDIDTIERSIYNWQESLPELRKWYHFSDKYNDIARHDVPEAIEHYLKHNTGEDTALRTHCGYYHTLAQYAIGNDSILRGFNGRLHSGEIEQYIASVGNLMSARREALPIEIENRIRTYWLTTEEKIQHGTLYHRMISRGRAVALRKIISDSSDVIQKVFPCMLMSPLSVAKFLEMRPDMFDIVIFDEASQVETADAVGAIARGGSVVVVGDPKQLPPTRFFTAQTASGEEIEENEDADSILEDCIALGLPSLYLSRHYRSRHESLIAFSNKKFYNNRLLTFPSHNDSEHRVSTIDPEGVYDIGRTRTNRIEAEAVVNYIIELLATAEMAPSIGVVAFSKPQSNLIDDLLSFELSHDRPLQRKLDQAQEPLFIKNLENVQGDERDIIIFSIGYGPDKNGSISLNFGPLNKEGGERRLNVAVSRAREEMVVFSSLKPSHIPESGSTSAGVAALRSFLAYASGETAESAESQSDISTDAIVDDIASQLRKYGMEVRTHVGRSSFRIDIAIIDTLNPDNYRYGIIVDGKDYRALPTVRDREVTVPSVLRKLGWQLRRIWAVDWLENPQRVLADLLNSLTAQ